VKRHRGNAGANVAPKKERDKLFCKKWLEHFDKDRAYREAGFKSKALALSTLASKKLNRFMEYLRPLQEAKAREVAKLLVVNEEQILQAMSRKAVFDPGDYVEISKEPLTETVKQEGKPDLTRVRTWHGEPIYGERLKPFHKLTPEQRMTVEIIETVGEQIRYRLPTIREQHQSQVALGRQFGMFIEKLILEHRAAKSAHNTLALTNVPTTELQQMTFNLLPYVGQEFASRLGFTLEDIEEAKKRVVSEVGPRT
jgi:hypothetical protein